MERDPPPPRDEDAPPDAGDATDGDASPAVEEQPETFAHDIKLALADIQRALGATRTADREPLFVSARDLFVREYPATQWRVHGLVSEGGILMIGAEPKSCKTWLASEVAVAVATGTSVCGEFPTARGAVAYFFAEDEAREVRNRVGALLPGANSIPRRGGPAARLPPRQVPGRDAGRGSRVDRRGLPAHRQDRPSHRRPASGHLLRGRRQIGRDVARHAATPAAGELLGSTVAVAHHAAKATPTRPRDAPGTSARSGSIHGATDSASTWRARWR